MIDKNEVICTTTGVRITPYHQNQNAYFEAMHSVKEMINKNFYRRNPVTGFFLDSDECYITHLSDPFLLQKEFPDYEIVEKRASKALPLSTPVNLNPDITPREVQYEIIQEVIRMENESQWFVYLSQGLGKTLLTVYLMTYFNVKTLVLCYNKDILTQWREVLIEKTNVNPKKILYLHTSLLLKRIIEGNFPVEEYDIFLATPKLLTSFANRNGFSHLHTLMVRMGIGFKVFDEAHRYITNIIKINAFTSVKRTIYLSGDFGQSNPNKERLYYKMFYKVPVIKPSIDLMNTLKFTVGIVMQYDSHPSEINQMAMYNKRGFSFYEYMKYQFNTEVFFDVLDYTLKMIQKTNQNQYKVLILVNLIDHVDQLYKQLLVDYGNSFQIGRYHSEVPEEEKEETKKHANMIVSTYQSFSTGIDVALIKYVISCSICTKIEDNQSSGRARPLPDGSDAYYFMFADVGFPYTKKKLGNRLQYLKETKIKAIQRIKYE